MEKGGVLALYDDVESRYGSAENIFFFIDADHDAFVGVEERRPQIFVTSGYSIENYLLDKDAIFCAVKKYFSVNKSDPLCSLVRTKVYRICELFESKSRVPMIYVVGLRMQDIDVRVENIGFSDLFEFTDGFLKRKKLNCNDLLRKLECSHFLEVQYIRRVSRELSKYPTISFVRGKLVSQFVAGLMRDIPSLFDGSYKISDRPLKRPFDFGNKNIMLIMSEFISIPIELRTFLKEIEMKIGSRRDK